MKQQERLWTNKTQNNHTKYLRLKWTFHFIVIVVNIVNIVNIVSLYLLYLLPLTDFQDTIKLSYYIHCIYYIVHYIYYLYYGLCDFKITWILATVHYRHWMCKQNMFLDKQNDLLDTKDSEQLEPVLLLPSLFVSILCSNSNSIFISRIRSMVMILCTVTLTATIVVVSVESEPLWITARFCCRTQVVLPKGLWCLRSIFKNPCKIV